MQSTGAATTIPELAKCAFLRHTEERAKIMEKLSCTVPDNFEDVNALMRFLIEMLITTLGTVLSDLKSTMGLRMLKNVREGITKSEVKLKVDAALKQMSTLEDARKDFLRIGA